MSNVSDSVERARPESGLKSWDWSLQQGKAVLMGLAEKKKPAQIAQSMGLTSRHIYALMYDLLQAGVVDLNPPEKRKRGRPWRDDVGYGAAHDRVRLTKGPARDHACKECGGSATDWAYSNSCPNEMVDEDGKRYSLDVNQYEPMCHGCHVRRDAAYRRSV